jgi:hypothetical protein
MNRSSSDFDINIEHRDKSQGPLPAIKRLSTSKEYLKMPSCSLKGPLPPLKNSHKSSNKKDSVTANSREIVIPDGMKPNGFPSRFRSGHRTDSSEEWIVHRPLKVRPKDLLKLEGSLDLGTTFRDSYDKNRHGTNVAQHVDEKRSLEPQPQIFGKRRSTYRPKTSLKTGGEGYYHTVTRDSYKRFVVVDLNNNDSTTLLDVKELTIDDNGIVVEENKISSHELRSKTYRNNRPSRSRVRQKQIKDEDFIVPQDDQKEAGRQEDDGSPKEGKYEEKRRDRKNEKETRGDEAISVKTSANLDKSLESAEVTSSPHHANHDNATPCRKEVAIMTDSIDDEKCKMGKLWRHFNDESHTRHSSLPRSSRRTNKHKNDSQLKFDGSMDFQTTSRVFHHGSSRSQECLKADEQVQKRRDLFQASEDIASLGKGHPVVQGTTYSTFFKDRHSCPATKVQSGLSDYKFKREFGGHSFYCSCQSST